MSACFEALVQNKCFITRHDCLIGFDNQTSNIVFVIDGKKVPEMGLVRQHLMIEG